MYWLLKPHGSVFYNQTFYDLLIMAFLYAAYLLRIEQCSRLPNVGKYNLMKFNIFLSSIHYWNERGKP